MDVGLVILRLTVGLTLSAHGAQKLFGAFGGPGLAGTAHIMESLGFRPGRRHGLLAGFTEFGGGVLLAIGLFTPLAAALILSVMIVAAFSAHLQNGFFAMNGGYELAFVLGAAALSVGFTGAGAFSVDALVGWSFAGVAWGIGAAAVAAVGASVELVQRRTPATVAQRRTAA